MQLTNTRSDGSPNPIQPKRPPATSFSPITSPKVGDNPIKFMTLSFDPFATIL